ncbi:hypothetical protein Achl_4227 (plasmid) [Pseudarthrobacter chlorophenolicus A6]|uniref:Uncharacterized protein n=1 Tax=Pseudarthrobacter chlorophenolicus (strain ATCC 700700 / DSM 12829 / CIP 107037 / JCM 12360 / KCTC 9906 / NCIMB 13794 / A6) TaxID=452863 RepID=B8HID1_PSECP|nr:hypothetical protein [Pseudarthrobacter chlorophenolicus]ACL42178.1 hypothetical protein Achl_4227 [Pseudarthrobacter chlorophenolicus A6]SDQ14471.1 hypothetical protein SAMN04489738_0285 [Pseudarthrobacter chlorophenolicus]
MSTLQSRVSRGIPTGGQFAATEHAEPALSLDVPPTDPAILANLRRPAATVTITEEQAENLRRHKTPIMNTAARRRAGDVMVDLTATDAHIRDIQDRLRGR